MSTNRTISERIWAQNYRRVVLEFPGACSVVCYEPLAGPQRTSDVAAAPSLLPS